MARTATPTFEGKSVVLPVVEGSEGELAVDVTRLRAETGLTTLDHGSGDTGACESAITFIDGERGNLRYRGIPIERLAEHSNFVEVAWLLIYGRLPSHAEPGRFGARLTRHAPPHEALEHHSRASRSTPRRGPCSRP